MKLTFIQTGDSIFVGKVDSECPSIIHNPRKVRFNDEESKLVLQIPIGAPEFMFVSTSNYVYENADDDFLEFYETHINEGFIPIKSTENPH